MNVQQNMHATKAAIVAQTNNAPISGRTLRWCDVTPELIERWESFCTANPLYMSPFYWPQFTQAVAEVRSDARIAIFERQSEVIGFLPFHLTQSGTAKPIGGQLNDYQGPVLGPGVTLSAQELLRSSGITAYDYNHLPLTNGSLARSAVRTAFSPQMDLSKGYDALIARKGSRLEKARRDVVRCSRKTERDLGPIEFRFHNNDEDTYHKHAEMKAAHLGAIGSDPGILSGWTSEVLARLRRMQGPKFSTCFATLHAGDRLIAAHFGLRSATILHWWFPSYDAAARNLGPGINLLDKCAAAANAHGITTIDFGRGAGAYKLKFANNNVELGEGSLTLPASSARFVRTASERLVSAAEKLPLGQYSSYPRRAAARLVSGVALGRDRDNGLSRSIK